MTREQFITRVEETQGAFRRFLVALCCGNSPLADDIAQEAYIKAYLSTDTLKDQSSFRSWLFRIGYTTFINHRRASRSHESYDEAREIAAPEATDNSFRYQALYSALEKLPPKERTSVLLFYLEGYSTREVADIEGCSEAAVRQHLLRGRNHLRGLLYNN